MDGEVWHQSGTAPVSGSPMYWPTFGSPTGCRARAHFSKTHVSLAFCLAHKTRGSSEAQGQREKENDNEELLRQAIVLSWKIETVQWLCCWSFCWPQQHDFVNTSQDQFIWVVTGSFKITVNFHPALIGKYIFNPISHQHSTTRLHISNHPAGPWSLVRHAQMK